MQWAQFFRHQCKWEGWQQRSAESELRNPVSLASCYVSATYPHDPLRGDVMTAFLQSRPGPRRSLGGHLPIFRRHHHRENYPGARCHGGNATAGWSLMVVDGGSSLSVADALNVIYGDYPWESFCNQWNTSELMNRWLKCWWWWDCFSSNCDDVLGDFVYFLHAPMHLSHFSRHAGAGDYSAIRWLAFGPATVGSRGPCLPVIACCNWRSVWFLTLAGHSLKAIYSWRWYTPKLILYKMHMLYLYKMLFRDSFYRGLAWPSIKCPSRAPYFIIL